MKYILKNRNFTPNVTRQENPNKIGSFSSSHHRNVIMTKGIIVFNALFVVGIGWWQTKSSFRTLKKDYLIWYCEKHIHEARIRGGYERIWQWNWISHGRMLQIVLGLGKMIRIFGQVFKRVFCSLSIIFFFASFLHLSSFSTCLWIVINLKKTLVWIRSTLISVHKVHIR